MTRGGPGNRSAAIRAAFLRACWLDVAVRKPGNVSRASAGHRMHAELFIRSAEAAVGPLTEPGARVGERVEHAVAATWQAVGCNTNLGIVLLCAPIARAAERAGPGAAALQAELNGVLGALDPADSRAAFRAIAQANPGGLGRAPEQDVHSEPTLGLRAAMALAADRDRVARQYRDGFAELFALAARAWPAELRNVPGAPTMQATPDALVTDAVQRLFLDLLEAWPDSHIVRKHGDSVAQNVMTAAQRFVAKRNDFDADPRFAAWDEQLKADGINPGTTADLCVATLLLVALTAEPPSGCLTQYGDSSAEDGMERVKHADALAIRARDVIRSRNRTPEIQKPWQKSIA